MRGGPNRYGYNKGAISVKAKDRSAGILGGVLRATPHSI